MSKQSGAVGLWCVITFEGAGEEPPEGYKPHDVQYHGEIVAIDDDSVWVELYGWILAGNGDGEVKAFPKPANWEGWTLYRTSEDCFRAAFKESERHYRREAKQVSEPR